MLTYDEIIVGKKYKVKPEFVDECGSCESGFDYLIVTRKSRGALFYTSYKNGRPFTSCFECYTPEMLVAMESKTFGDLVVGDIVLSNCGEKCEVMFANGKVVIIKNADAETNTYCEEEFDINDFTIPSSEPEVVELSMDDIAAKFNVTVDKLKIKK